MQAAGFLVHLAVNSQYLAPSFLGSPIDEFTRQSDGVWSGANGTEYWPSFFQDHDLSTDEAFRTSPEGAESKGTGVERFADTSEFLACNLQEFDPAALWTENETSVIRTYDFDYSYFAEYAEEIETVHTVPGAVRKKILATLEGATTLSTAMANAELLALQTTVDCNFPFEDIEEEVEELPDDDRDSEEDAAERFAGPGIHDPGHIQPIHDEDPEVDPNDEPNTDDDTEANRVGPDVGL